MASFTINRFYETFEKLKCKMFIEKEYNADNYMIFVDFDRHMIV